MRNVSSEDKNPQINSQMTVQEAQEKGYILVTPDKAKLYANALIFCKEHKKLQKEYAEENTIFENETKTSSPIQEAS